MAANVLELTDDNFASEVLEAEEPVLVDFWAPWCGPCKLLGPTIEELAGDYAGKARVGKMNTDNNRNVAMQHQISALPTIVLFKKGEPVARFTGVTPKEKLASAIDTQLSD